MMGTAAAVQPAAATDAAPTSAREAQDGAKRLAALRDAMDPYRRRSTPLALAFVAADVLLFVAGQALVVAGPGLGFRLLGALLAWVGIVRLFLIGHDACHGALVDSDRLNAFLGRLAFLPSLTPFSLWHVGHNVVHHGFNNLRGRDFVWEPLSPEEYRALPRWRRAMERLYRGSAAGPGPYYFFEIWWKRLYFPGLARLRTTRAEFILDCTLVTVAGLAWVAGLVWAALASGISPVVTVGLGFVVPFALWIWTMGLVIYLHHTAPDVRWFDDRRQWLREAAQATATTHLRLPAVFEMLLHRIMDHPAHHLDGTIPFYHLKAAQQRLRELMPELTAVRFSWRYYRDCLRTCQLYDYSSGGWKPFAAA
jgi:omega-6 fatty acid desaturase (delta-12 desaturase)